MNTTLTVILLFYISVMITVTVWISIYNVWKDKVTKETMFEIQLKSAGSVAIKDALPVTELYSIIDGTIKFYAARQLSTSNLAERSDQELSLMLDDVVLTIASNVEMHLSDKFKSMWEVYFDPVPTENGEVPSHLNLYIYDNTKLILIRAIESMKTRSDTKPHKKNK